MTKTLFTAHSASKGGRNGHTGTTDGRLSFALSMPGGPKKSGTTTNPEELFACGYAACFGSAIDHVAGMQKVSAEGLEVKADVSLNQDDSGFFLGITLNVTLPNLDQQAAEKLVATAHQVCPYSKATRNNVDVKLSVNNQDLAKAA